MTISHTMTAHPRLVMKLQNTFVCMCSQSWMSEGAEQ